MAQWRAETFIRRLKRAADSFEHDKVVTLCRGLIEHLRQRQERFPKNPAEKTLNILRRKRYFKLMQQVADAFIRTGLRYPKIYRQYAQALLDDRNIAAGLSVLRSALAEFRLSQKEMAEVQGLIGRAYKQIYMDADDIGPAQNRDALRTAISTYYGIYRSNKQNLWHGINTVSLLNRARRDKVVTRGLPGAEIIAAEILRTLYKKGGPKKIDIWDTATGAEALVALGRWKEAGDWLRRYVGNRNADAFELASTLRQFEEVIQLDRARGNERYLLDLLRSQLIKRQGGEIRFRPEMVNERASGAKNARDGLENVLGRGYKPHRWLLTSLKRAQIVGHIWKNGRGKASGFLLPDGSVIHPRWKNQQLFLTNKHVISDTPIDYRTLKPEEAEITFDALHGGGTDQPRYKADLLWESSAEVDTSILRLKQAVQGFEVYGENSRLLGLNEGKRIYVIGHPEGKELSYSLQNNRLVALDDGHLHYRSPTTYGSSGSPLFDDDWRLVGIHHGSSDKSLDVKNKDEDYKANEGIPLKAIISEVEKTYKIRKSPRSRKSHEPVLSDRKNRKKNKGR